MKINFFFFSIILIPCLAFSQKSATTETAADLVNTINEYHYSPIQTGDEFSERVFDSFIKQIDRSGLYLTQQDHNKLKEYRHSLDEAIVQKESFFLTAATDLLEKRIAETISNIESLEFKHLDFNEKKSLSFYEEPLTKDQLQTRWKKAIQFDLLADYFSLYEEKEKQEKDEFIDFAQKGLGQKINSIVCEIKEKYNTNEGLNEFVDTKYLKAISSAYDPHTTYFNPEENNRFNEHLSKEALSFGWEIYKNEEGEFELYNLSPGGPAWNSLQLNEGDILKEIKSTDGVNIDMTCMSSVEFEKTMDEVKSATFTFKKSDGSFIELVLNKQKVEVAENIIDNYILDGEKKLGYIYLPSFYSDRSEGNGIPIGCANDFAKQLLRLKRENIEGLIIDLRNNGGGSMLEAIRLAGIFINFGAIAISENKEKEAVTMKDLDRGTIFTKPLLVLVNGYSASASELFAAAMQDHNRAIIAGSNTFGKATFQDIVPVDAHKYNLQIKENQSSTNKGYVKITMGKFYRVTGKSHQGEGVVVDISLPSEDSDSFHEKDMPYALSNTSISKKTYYTPLQKIQVEDFYQNSLQPQKKNQGKENSIPVSFEEFKHFINSSLENEVTKSDTGNLYFSVTHPEYMLGMDSSTESEKKIQKNTVQSIETDPSIIESYRILSNLINHDK